MQGGLLSVVFMISQERLKYLFNYENGELVRRTVEHRVGRIGQKIGWSHNGYIRAVVDQEFEYVHRLIWIFHFGSIPDGMEIDHINHNKRDNRIENLRAVTPLTNKRNRSKAKHNSSGYSNIRYRSDIGKYQVRFKVNGREQSFGWFPTVEEAIVERNRAQSVLGFHPNHGLTIA